jgi:hypothetical protein
MRIGFLLLIIIFPFIYTSCLGQRYFPQQLKLKVQNPLQYKVDIDENVNYKADSGTASNVKSFTSFNTVLTPILIEKDSIKMAARILEIRAKIKGLPGRENNELDTTLKLNDNNKSAIHFDLNSKGKFTGIEQTEFQQEGMPYMPYFTQFLTSVFLELPSKQLKAEDSWKSVKVDTIRQGLSKLIINMPLTYTYKSNKDTLGYSCAVVNFVSTAFDISLQDELMKIFNIEYTLEGEGLIKGRMLIDRISGKTIAVDQSSLTSYTLGIITPNNIKNVIPVKTSQQLKAYILK